MELTADSRPLASMIRSTSAIGSPSAWSRGEPVIFSAARFM